MNKSQIFKAAHQLTKATIQAGDCYRVNFSAALKIIISQFKEDIIMTTMQEKLIAAGGRIWEKDAMKRIYLSQAMVDACDLGIRFNDKKHKLFFDLNTNQFSGTSDTFVKALNAKI